MSKELYHVAEILKGINVGALKEKGDMGMSEKESNVVNIEDVVRFTTGHVFFRELVPKAQGDLSIKAFFYVVAHHEFLRSNLDDFYNFELRGIKSDYVWEGLSMSEGIVLNAALNLFNPLCKECDLSDLRNVSCFSRKVVFNALDVMTGSKLFD